MLFQSRLQELQEAHQAQLRQLEAQHLEQVRQAAEHQVETQRLLAEIVAKTHRTPEQGGEPPTKRHRIGSPVKSTPLVPTDQTQLPVRLAPETEGLAFSIAAFTTVPSAYEAFQKIALLPRAQRKWQGNKDRDQFKVFKKGLAAEITSRGLQGVQELEMERLSVTPKQGRSPLQHLSTGYYLRHLRSQKQAATKSN